MATRDKHLNAYRQHVITGMAGVLWMHAWVDHAEKLIQLGARGLDRPGPGESWDDYIPARPPSARKAANELAELYEFSNGDLVDLYGLAIETDTGAPYEYDAIAGQARDVATPRAFGMALANMALSTGSSWFDDHKKFELDRPSFECWLDEDGEELHWSGRTMVKGPDAKQLNRHNPTGDAWIDDMILEYVEHATYGNDHAVTAAMVLKGGRGPELRGRKGKKPSVEVIQLKLDALLAEGLVKRRGAGYAITEAGLAPNEPYELDIEMPPVGGRPNPSRAELRDPKYVQDTIQEGLESELRQKVGVLEILPGPTGKVKTREQLLRDISANLATALVLDDEGELENPAGAFSPKGERMYKAIKAEYASKRSPRAAEIAARTVYSQAKKDPSLLSRSARKGR